MRYSTESLKLNGANKVAKLVDGIVSTVYTNSTGTEPAIPVDGQLSYNETSFISPNNYGVLYSYFISKGSSDVHAKSQVLLALDVCKQEGISVIEFVSKQYSLYDDDKFLDYQNNVRTDSLKVGKLSTNLISESKIYRQILA
jgi:hypothetical protein